MTDDSVEINGREIEYIDWYGLYKEKWRSEISKESMSHPAKFSRALIREIYDHCIEEGWLKAGDCVVDPFGGVGLGALDAQSRGINWVGVEIEPRFFTLAMGGECDGQPIEVDDGREPVSGWYILFEDDDTITWFVDCEAEVTTEPDKNGFVSKKVAELWLSNLDKDGNFEDANNIRIEERKFSKKQINPAPCGLRKKHDPHHITGNLELWQETYAGKLPRWGKAVMLKGDSRNLANLLRDNAESVPCGKNGALTSPPYASTLKSGHYEPSEGDRQHRINIGRNPDSPGSFNLHDYGGEEGNLGGMGDEGFDQAISSPPFLQTSGGTNVTSTEGPLSDPAMMERHSAGNAATHAYGESDGQMQAMGEGDYDAALSSPPYADAISRRGGDTRKHWDNSEDAPFKIGESSIENRAYSDTPENIGNLPDEGFDSAISSPPFTGVVGDGGWQMLGNYAEKGQLTVGQVKGDPNKSYPSWDKDRDTSYGKSDGQLANMEEGEVDAAISSPPYADIAQQGGTAGIKSHGTGLTGGEPHFGEYGEIDGQLGRMGGEGFDAALSSPPYEPDALGHSGGFSEIDVQKALHSRIAGARYGQEEGQIGSMPTGEIDAALTSPPYADIDKGYGDRPNRWDKVADNPNFAGRTHWKENDMPNSYGDNTEGNLSVMKDGNIDAALTSPPYAHARIDGAGDEGASNLRNEDGSFLRGSEGWEKRKEMGGRYGDTEGQLGGMDDGEYDASINSPPFESVTSDRPSANIVASGLKMGASSMGNGYGDTEGQIGNQSGDNFWMASRIILDNLFRVLRPGAHAAFVVKKYVKNKQIEDFPHKWARLCEAAGFVVVHWHRAWVIESRGTQYDLFTGEPIERIISRKSFFRKLAEKRGSPAIDYEEVLCCIKPDNASSAGKNLPDTVSQ